MYTDLKIQKMLENGFVDDAFLCYLENQDPSTYDSKADAMDMLLAAALFYRNEKIFNRINNDFLKSYNTKLDGFTLVLKANAGSKLIKKGELSNNDFQENEIPSNWDVYFI